MKQGSSRKRGRQKRGGELEPDVQNKLSSVTVVVRVLLRVFDRITRLNSESCLLVKELQLCTKSRFPSLTQPQEGEEIRDVV